VLELELLVMLELELLTLEELLELVLLDDVLDELEPGHEAEPTIP
jgi:hypothetical protein